MSVTVMVTVGVGMWKSSKTVELVACPHVGDWIVVGERTVVCDRVTITAEKVYVEQTIRFSSEDAAKTYFDE